MSAKRARDRWEKLVDSVEGSSEAIVLTDDVREYIQSRRALYEASKAVFFPQMTADEACRAQPLKTNTTDSLQGGDSAPVQGINFLKDFAPMLRQSHMTASTKLERVFVPATEASLIAAAVQSSGALPNGGVLKQRADFIPIVMIPSTPLSILQIWNIQDFVERGKFVEAPKKFVREEDGSTVRRDAEECVIASPGNLIDETEYRVQFRSFKFVEDPKHVDNWDHVCACIVTGNNWQFEGWFNGDKAKVDPSVLFSEVRGFLPFFEEDKPVPQKDQWRVVPIQMTRKMTNSSTQHLRGAAIFWEEVYKFLDSHPRFRTYTLPPSLS